jgi:membrane protein required for colicin V production
MTLAAFDIVCVVLIVILVVRCAIRGFVDEVMSMASVVLGILAAMLFYKNGAAYIRINWIEMNVLPEVLAFAAIFLIVFLLVRLVEHLLKDIINGIHLNGFDRFLGMIFGLLEAFVLICVILFVISIQPLFDPAQLLHNSVAAKLLLPLVTNVQSSFFTIARL